MKKNGRQSQNVEDVTDPKAAEKHNAKTKMLVDAMNSPRLLVNEPIAYNQDKSPKDRLFGALKNPGKKKTFDKSYINATSDPEPQKFSKGKKRKNYENIPDFEFFKHTTKEK